MKFLINGLLLSLLALTAILTACKKDQPAEPAQKELRIKVVNGNLAVRVELRYMAVGEGHTEFLGVATLRPNETAYYDIPSNALIIQASGKNLYPLPTTRIDRKEFEMQFSISDYSGAEVYDINEISKPIYKLISGWQYYTENSNLSWAVNLERYR